MNNEIALRTSKGEYHPGDTVYGAVYLHICRPTEGTGIKITFKGTETCHYDYKCEQSRSLASETDQVDYSDVTLYAQDDTIEERVKWKRRVLSNLSPPPPSMNLSSTGCFDFGCYAFPFKFELPKEIAGTFSMIRKQQEVTWNIQVAYNIKAYVLGSEGIQVSQPIIIYQCHSQEYQESSTGTAEHSTFTLQRFVFSNKTVHVTVKLLKNFTESGSNLQIRLVVTNNSNINVTGLHVKLLRSLKLFFSDEGTETQSMTSNMEKVGSKVVVRPEHGPFVIQDIGGASEALMVGVGGINGLQVPLRERLSGGEIVEAPPSVSGKRVKNNYDLEVCVTFSNGHVEKLIIHVPGVLPKRNEEWLQWKEPDWAFNCEIKTNNSSFSVPEYLMHSEALSGLPMFQVL